MATNYRKENTNSICNFTFFHVGYSPRNFWAFHGCCFYMSCALFCWPLTEKKQCLGLCIQSTKSGHVHFPRILRGPCMSPRRPALPISTPEWRHRRWGLLLLALIESYLKLHWQFFRTANPNSNEVSPKWLRYNATPHCTTKKQENQ